MMRESNSNLPLKTKSNLKCITKQRQKQMKYFLGNKSRHVRYRFALIHSDMLSVWCCFIGCMTKVTQAFGNIIYNRNCICFGVNTGQRTHNMTSVYQIIGFHRESQGGLTFQVFSSLIDAPLMATVRQQLSANWPLSVWNAFTFSFWHLPTSLLPLESKDLMFQS